MPQPGDSADTGSGVGQGSQRARSRRSTTWEMSIEPSRSRAYWMERPGVLPSVVSCLRPRTDWKGFSGAACRVTRVSEEMPQGGQCLVLGRAVATEFV